MKPRERVRVHVRSSLPETNETPLRQGQHFGISQVDSIDVSTPYQKESQVSR